MKTSSPLASLLNRHALKRLAGSRYFERGEEYFADGLVRGFTEDEGTLVAKVRGTQDYRVKFWVDSGKIEYACTCPLGTEEVFCKHCVAVGLAWLAGSTEGALSKAGQPKVTSKDVQVYLEGQEKGALVRLILERTQEDDRLRERLLMKAARATSKGLDLATFRQAIDNAVETSNFVDWRSSWDYAQGIEEVISSIEELLKEGHAPEVVELAEYFLKTVEEHMDNVDDSDGNMGDILEGLQELHHNACKQAKPNPEGLAKRLFEWELRTDYDLFSGAAAIYANVLGERGFGVYRRLAEAEWSHVLQLAPNQKDPDQYGRRYRITHIMETLAELSKDVEALVAIKKRNLSHAFAYLEIAEAYKKAGRDEQSLEWAEKGVKAFPNRTDSRLREFLADEYHRLKRHEEAMALMWAEFTEGSHLEDYQLLKKHADKISAWPEWRQRALVFLREEIAKAKKTDRKEQWGWSPRADHSELVRIFLWQKDEETAWQEAKAGGCTNDLWMQLAARRERKHPEDALPIYQARIDLIVDRKNNESYREAVQLLRKIRDLMARLGHKVEFSGYLETVRTKHKPKRNFMKLIDQMK